LLAKTRENANLYSKFSFRVLEKCDFLFGFLGLAVLDLEGLTVIFQI
jgi:hypothetical protein